MTLESDLNVVSDLSRLIETCWLMTQVTRVLFKMLVLTDDDYRLVLTDLYLAQFAHGPDKTATTSLEALLLCLQHFYFFVTTLRLWSHATLLTCDFPLSW